MFDSFIDSFVRSSHLLPRPRTLSHSLNKNTIQVLLERTEQTGRLKKKKKGSKEREEMADKATAEGSLPNLHKDKVTGEMVSKSELKKRQKKRDGDAKKVFIFVPCPPHPPSARRTGRQFFYIFLLFFYSILF